MANVKKKIPAAKPITFLAFGFAVAIAVMFLSGLMQFKGADKAIGLNYVTDFIKAIVDFGVGDYFKFLGEEIGDAFKAIEGAGLGGVLGYILELLGNLIIVFFFLGVTLHLLFSWLPLVQAGSIGWSRASIRMGKKLKKILSWALGYIVFNFMVYGRNEMELTAMGKMAIYAVAVFASLRVLLKHLASKDNVVHTIFCTISTVAMAVFMIVFFSFLLSYLEGGRSVVGKMLEYLNYVFELIKGDSSEAGDLLLSIVLLLFSVTFILVVVNIVKNAMASQVEDKGGIRGTMIAVLIWMTIIIALHFYATKNIGEVNFSEWKKTEEAKFMVKAFVYGLVGLGISIASSILCCIGKKKERSKDEDVYEDEK
jgi:hypothetical protein